MTAAANQHQSFEQVQAIVQPLLARAAKSQEKLRRLQSNISEVNLFRPIKAYHDLRAISRERDLLNLEVPEMIDQLSRVLFLTPDKTMGEALASCLDTIRLSAIINRLQIQWVEVDSGLQQAAAFAFAIFALYVSLLSIALTLVLGVIPLFA